MTQFITISSFPPIAHGPTIPSWAARKKGMHHSIPGLQTSSLYRYPCPQLAFTTATNGQMRSPASHVIRRWRTGKGMMTQYSVMSRLSDVKARPASGWTRSYTSLTAMWLLFLEMLHRFGIIRVYLINASYAKRSSRRAINSANTNAMLIQPSAADLGFPASLWARLTLALIGCPSRLVRS